MDRTKRLIVAAEDYFTGLRRMRESGGATGERSSYGPLAALLDAVGATLSRRTAAGSWQPSSIPPPRRRA